MTNMDDMRKAEKQVTLQVMDAIGVLAGKAPARRESVETRESGRIGWGKSALRTR